MKGKLRELKRLAWIPILMFVAPIFLLGFCLYVLDQKKTQGGR